MYSCLKRRLFIRVSLATSYTHKKKSHKRWWQSLMHDTEASKTNTERYFFFHGLAIFVIPSCSPRLLDRKTSIFLSLFDLLQFIQFYKLCSQNVPWRPLAESVWLLGRSLCHKEAKRMNKQSKKFQKMHWNGKRSLILAFHQPGSHLGPGMWMHRTLNDSAPDLRKVHWQIWQLASGHFYWCSSSPSSHTFLFSFFFFFFFFFYSAVTKMCLDGRRWSRFGFWAIGALICAEILGVFHWTCIVHCILCFWGAGYLYDFRSWPEKQMLSCKGKEYKEPYPHIQKSSSSNPPLFVPESTFPRMITFIRKAKEKWLFAQQTSTTICTRFDAPWKSPAESAWLLGRSLCHWANPWGNENVCIQHSLSAKLSVQQLCRSFWIFMMLHVFMSEAPTIHSSLACDLIHTQKKNLTNGDGKAWCMILKLQKQIQRDISSSMVLLSSSFHLVLLDY